MKPLSKTVQRSNDLFIQFTKEELQQLNLQEGDKLSWEECEGGVCLKKFVTMDIDITDWSREILEHLVQESAKRDVTVNDLITEYLEEFCSRYSNGGI